MRNKILSSFLGLGLVLFLAASAQALPNFAAALNGAQVVPPNSSEGRAHCTVTLTNNVVTQLNCEYSGLSNNPIYAAVQVVGPEYQVCGGFIQGELTGNFTMPCSQVGVYAFPNLSSLLQKRARVALYTGDSGYPEIQGQLRLVTLDSDINGDGRTEISVFRPDDSTGYSYSALNDTIVAKSFAWHTPDHDPPFLADFDGDGIADWASISRDLTGDTGQMFVVYRRSSDDTVVEVQWGNDNYGDIPAFGDYNGDGTTEKAVFRPTDGVWYISESEFGDGGVRYEQWGAMGDEPCPADYDGDGKTDLCVVRAEDGYRVWYINRSSDQGMYVAHWGIITDTIYPRYPVDVDDDGINDVLVSRVDENGLRYFYAQRSTDNSMFALQWGLAEDMVKLGDYDADGKTDFVAIRTIDNSLVWFINQSSDKKMKVAYFGMAGDK